MLYGNVGTCITDSRIKRVTFYIPPLICKEGAKVNALIYMFVILNT